eukprot:CCRYP_011651-RA/>CCRYP_011651-RA protein AED:0.41 eAED:0.45 QI:649/0/0.5/1/0/0/2/0/74
MVRSASARGKAFSDMVQKAVIVAVVIQLKCVPLRRCGFNHWGRSVQWLPRPRSDVLCDQILLPLIGCAEKDAPQ